MQVFAAFGNKRSYRVCTCCDRYSNRYRVRMRIAHLASRAECAFVPNWRLQALQAVPITRHRNTNRTDTMQTHIALTLALAIEGASAALALPDAPEAHTAAFTGLAWATLAVHKPQCSTRYVERAAWQCVVLADRLSRYKACTA